MSRSLFWAVASSFIVLAGAIGWMVGAPHPSPTPKQPVALAQANQPLSQMSAPPAAPTPQVQNSSDNVSRDALRTNLAAALDRMEASPCDPEARAAFLDAYADRAGAIGRAAAQADDGRPAEWNTHADAEADQNIERLIKAGYFTEDEIGLAAVQKWVGKDELARLQQPARGSGPMRSTRC